jgi:hypothetical protein
MQLSRVVLREIVQNTRRSAYRNSAVRTMGKSKKSKPSTPESALVIPKHPCLADQDAPIVDTHCHMLSTFSFYKSKYPDGDKNSVQDFVRAYFAQEQSNRIEGLVDVYCEPPFSGWKECASQLVRYQPIFRLTYAKPSRFCNERHRCLERCQV